MSIEPLGGDAFSITTHATFLSPCAGSDRVGGMLMTSTSRTGDPVFRE
ncbi:MAG: hypothetical protein GY788_23585 [bacterium]|nr:hypothetical protein [bacterium]